MNSKNKALRQGVIVFVGLAVLTAIEYVVAVLTGLWFILAVLALIKAFLVVVYYMHIGRLFTSEESEHS